jgi:hypothetical protein
MLLKNSLSFIQSIEELVKPKIKTDSKEEYVFYRDKHGCWACIPANHGENIPDEISSTDPLAIKFSGENLTISSFPAHTYLLTARLHRELRRNDWSDLKEMESIVYFMDESIGKLPTEAIECLANHETPVQLLADTIPFSVKLDGFAFNKDVAVDALEILSQKLKVAKGA